MIADNTPVLIGVGQSVERIDAPDHAGLSAADLAAAAARAAIVDCGVDVSSSIDAIGAIRTFDDSFPFVPPFGVPDNFPRAIARRLRIDPVYAALGRLGGDTPIALIGQMGARIANGDTSVALIAGGEAISTVRHLTKLGETRDWAERDDGQVDDTGVQLEDLIKPYQVIHGLRGAPAVYGMCENARRGRLKMSKSSYALAMGDLFARFMSVAADNRFACAAVEPMSAYDLTDIGPRNRMVADPYPVRLVSRDQVNQGASLLMTSVAKARELGIREDRWVYVHGLALGTERDLIERPDLGSAPTAKATIDAALAAANKNIAAIDHLDFYSCFPIAVFAVSVDALGISPDDPRGLTVTGGLPFFGGPGNNYATHAVATMVERLRANRSDSGLVFALGGYMSKFGAAVLSSQPASWPDIPNIQADDHPVVAIDWHPNGIGRLLTYTILYAEGCPVKVVVIGKLKSGARFIANNADAETLARCMISDIIDALVKITPAAEGNRFVFI